MNRRQFVTGAVAAGTTTIAGCGGADDTQMESSGSPSSAPTAGDQSTADEPASGVIRATLQTSMGDVAVELYGDRAPRTVENFVGLATGTRTWVDPETGDRINDEPLYEDVLVHRVVDDFVIQTGDPTGTGRGGPGYQFADEFHEDLRHDGPGVLSMANSGPDTNGSQFFITLAATPHLDDRHSVFGRVTDGMRVVRAIGAVETDANDRPVDPVVLESVAVDR